MAKQGNLYLNTVFAPLWFSINVTAWSICTKKILKESSLLEEEQDRVKTVYKIELLASLLEEVSVSHKTYQYQNYYISILVIKYINIE